jgi:hypothetical protein
VKPSAALFVATLSLTISRPAAAVETRADVETDHVTAADDEGPRTAGLLVRALSMATGWLGAEIDVSSGPGVAMSAEGAERWGLGNRAYRVALGVALYPQRPSFHGVYVHPVVEWARAAGDHMVGSALVAGLTVGYAWTWPAGATVRIGGGVSYARALRTPPGSDPRPSPVVEGLQPRVDVDVGWVF